MLYSQRPSVRLINRTRLDRRGPPGERLYVVGDVHGQADLLQAILSKIDVIEGTLASAHTTEIFVGDYVDRGSESAAVLDALSRPPSARRRICLRGNHEQMMLRFVADASAWENWRALGGIDTLVSYGVPRSLIVREKDPHVIRQAFLARLPEVHLSFLNQTPSFHRAGEYFFVHAGLRPGTPLEQQSEQDMLWIRSGFVDTPYDFGVTVVHGHTPAAAVFCSRERIGVDTGAYATRRLSCIVIQDDFLLVLEASMPQPKA